MNKLKTFAIAVAILGHSYGFSIAQGMDDLLPTTLSDEDYLALANGEALDMFADQAAPLMPGDPEIVYLLGLDQVESSFFCALDVLDEIAEQIGPDQNGLLFVEVADVSPYLDSANCFASQTVVDIVADSHQGY
ncbi:MAG: hypothetical protein L3J33_08430 [Rhodobacteraceae bacterium]|nr:hypothetical protein [Paracoccaceae bacterium]